MTDKPPPSLALPEKYLLVTDLLSLKKIGAHSEKTSEK
jgi:hypothetical protein